MSKNQNFSLGYFSVTEKVGNFGIVGHEVEDETKKGKTKFVVEACVVRGMFIDKISNKIRSFCSFDQPYTRFYCNHHNQCSFFAIFKSLWICSHHKINGLVFTEKKKKDLYDDELRDEMVNAFD